MPRWLQSTAFWTAISIGVVLAHPGPDQADEQHQQWEESPPVDEDEPTGSTAIASIPASIPAGSRVAEPTGR